MVVVVAVAVPVAYVATRPPPTSGGGGGTGHNTTPPELDSVYPGFLTIAYSGSSIGYLGPTTEEFCGNVGGCSTPISGYFTETAGQPFSWPITISNPSGVSHSVSFFLVTGPFVLQSFGGDATISPGTTTTFTLTILAPSTVGLYGLGVTLVTEH